MIKDGPVYCDCCGRVQLAVIRDGKLAFYDKRHGQKHWVTLDLTTISSNVRVSATT